MTDAALQLSDISHNYAKRRALEGVGFSVPSGQVTVLLGPNGAGKTTLFGLISRLLPLKDGRIIIAGRSLKAAGAAALEPLGIVFQQPTLDLDLTVRQNLTYFADLRGIARHVAGERIAGGLERFDLAERADDAVRELNGGHRRRVEIVRATLHEPAILILDEPTVGLDIPTRKAIVADLHARAASGTAVLRTFFELGPFSNYRLTGAVLLGTALQFAVIYVPNLQKFFHTVPLSTGDLVLAIAVSTSAFVVVEIVKLVRRK